MQPKDTVMRRPEIQAKLSDWETEHSIYDPFHYVFLLEAQAEITGKIMYKAGYEQSIEDHEWGDDQYKAKKAGRQEVVESLGLFENEMGFCEISNHIPYQAKLKEWGITASE